MEATPPGEARPGGDGAAPPADLAPAAAAATVASLRVRHGHRIAGALFRPAHATAAPSRGGPAGARRAGGGRPRR